MGGAELPSAAPCGVSQEPLQQRRWRGDIVWALVGVAALRQAAAFSGGGRCDGGSTTCVKQRAVVLAGWLVQQLLCSVPSVCVFRPVAAAGSACVLGC